MTRLKASEVASVRERLALEQGHQCKLCRTALGTGALRPVLDHDHNTGFIRGVLHSGCNALLGKIENNALMYGMNSPGRLGAFLSGALPYIQQHETPQHQMLHPSHRTDEEKRLRRNLRAKKARATKKAA